jgi:hypothetical protein
LDLSWEIAAPRIPPLFFINAHLQYLHAMRDEESSAPVGFRPSQKQMDKPKALGTESVHPLALFSAILDSSMPPPITETLWRPYWGTAYSFLFGEQSRNRPCHAVICNARHVPSGRKFIESVQVHLSHTHPFGCPVTAREGTAGVAFGQPPRFSAPSCPSFCCRLL